MRVNPDAAEFTPHFNIAPLGASGTALVKKDHRLMGRDFKALLTGLAGHIIIHSDEVIS